MDPNKLEILKELNKRRGSLPPEKRAIVEELNKRAGVPTTPAASLPSLPKPNVQMKQRDVMGVVDEASRGVQSGVVAGMAKAARVASVGGKIKPVREFAEQAEKESAELETDYENSGVAFKTGKFAGQVVAEAPMYAGAEKALVAKGVGKVVASVASQAGIDAAANIHKGVKEAAIEAGKGAIAGTVLGTTAKQGLKTRVGAGAVAMGGVEAADVAARGGSASDVAVAAGTGAVLGAVGGQGKPAAKVDAPVPPKPYEPAKWPDTKPPVPHKKPLQIEAGETRFEAGEDGVRDTTRRNLPKQPPMPPVEMMPEQKLLPAPGEPVQPPPTPPGVDRVAPDPVIAQPRPERKMLPPPAPPSRFYASPDGETLDLANPPQLDRPSPARPPAGLLPPPGPIEMPPVPPQQIEAGRQPKMLPPPTPPARFYGDAEGDVIDLNDPPSRPRPTPGKPPVALLERGAYQMPPATEAPPLPPEAIARNARTLLDDIEASRPPEFRPEDYPDAADLGGVDGSPLPPPPKPPRQPKPKPAAVEPAPPPTPPAPPQPPKVAAVAAPRQVAPKRNEPLPPPEPPKPVEDPNVVSQLAEAEKAYEAALANNDLKLAKRLGEAVNLLEARLGRAASPRKPEVSPAEQAYRRDKNELIARLWGEDGRGNRLKVKVYTDDEVEQIASGIAGGPVQIAQQGNRWVSPTGKLYADRSTALRGYVNEHVDDLMRKLGHDVPEPKAAAPKGPAVSDDDVARLVESDKELADYFRAEGIKSREGLIQAFRENIPEKKLASMVAKLPKRGVKQLAKDIVSDESGQFTPTALVDPIREGAKKLRGIFADVKDRVEDQMVDRYGAARRIFSDLAVDKDNPYVGFRLFSGIGGKIENRMHDFGEIVRKLDKSNLLEDAVEYGTYERLEELIGRGITKLPGGITPTEVAARMSALRSRLSPDQIAAIDGGLKEVRDYQDKLLTEARDAGLISARAYTSIKAQNRKYLPMLRVMGDASDNVVMKAGKAFSVDRQTVVRKVKGSERELINPFESILKNTTKLVDEIERNKAAAKVAEWAKRPNTIGVRRVAGKNPKAGLKKGEALFSVLEDGKKVQYAAPQTLVEAMKNLDAVQMGVLGTWFAKSASLLRAGATSWNIAFALPNWFRDQWSAKINSKYGYRVLADGLPAIADSYAYLFAGKRADSIRQFLESGGGGATRIDQFGNTPTKTLQQLRKGDGVVLKYFNPKKHAEALEMATRLGVYNRAKKAGADDAAAAFDARNATVDFAKAGHAGRAINMAVPFFNARLQGGLNTVKAMTETIANPSKYPNRVTALSLGGLAGLTALSHNSVEYPEVWDRISDRDKADNFIIIYGDSKDEKDRYKDVIKIPKGEPYRMLFGPIEAAFESYRKSNEVEWRKMAMEFVSQMSPVEFSREGEFSGSLLASQALPPAIKATAEAASGYDFYKGRPIETMAEQQRSPENRYDDNTPETFKVIGDATGTSPKRVQQVARDLTGGFAEYVPAVIEGGAKAAKGESGGTVGKLVDPVVRRFARSYDAGDADAFKDIGEVRQEKADRDFALAELAKRIMAAPENDRAGILQQAIDTGAVRESDYEKLAEKMEGTTDNRDRYSKSLAALSAEEQAEVLYRQLARRRTTEERHAYLEQIGDGVLKDGFDEHLARLLSVKPID